MKLYIIDGIMKEGDRIIDVHKYINIKKIII